MFLFFASCGDDDDSEPMPELPAALEFERTSQYPEDFAYDEANERFFMGSVFTGDIISVDWEGNVSALTNDASLIATVGILFDAANNEVVALNGNPGFSDQGQTMTTGALAEVVRFNADSGAEVARYDLSTLLAGGHLLNDLVMDDAGNIYVTDSFSPAIYRITPGGEMTIFATDPLFETAPGTFGLNGIAFNSDGFLLVAHSTNQTLLRVSIADPSDVSVVTVDQSIGGGDGIRMHDGNLFYLNNSFAGDDNLLHQLSSTDGFATATVSDTNNLGAGTFTPTTVEIVGDSPYVINSHLALLFSTPPVTDRATFEVNRVDF